MPRGSVCIATIVLAVTSTAWAADNRSISVDELQVPRTSSAPAPGQILQPPGAALSRAAAASVNEVRGRVDLCEKILTGESPPIPGLDCSRKALQALRAQWVLIPLPAATGSFLDYEIDSIGRNLALPQCKPAAYDQWLFCTDLSSH